MLWIDAFGGVLISGTFWYWICESCFLYIHLAALDLETWVGCPIKPVDLTKDWSVKKSMYGR
jgi:hypothetical protein